MGFVFWLFVVLLVGAILVWIATVAMATPTVSYRLDGRFDVRSTEFLHALSSVLPATVSRGNTIQRLDDGQRFYPEMLAAIGQARRSAQRGERGRRFMRMWDSTACGKHDEEHARPVALQDEHPHKIYSHQSGPVNRMGWCCWSLSPDNSTMLRPGRRRAAILATRLATPETPSRA